LEKRSLATNDRSELSLAPRPLRIANAIAEETLAMVKEKANLIAFPRSLSFR